MKKIFLTIVLSTISAFGCVCTEDIMAGFGQSSNHIARIIDLATNEIKSNLIPEIQKNTQSINEQNLELEKLLLAYQEELLQKKEVLFLLNKIDLITK